MCAWKGKIEVLQAHKFEFAAAVSSYFWHREKAQSDISYTYGKLKNNSLPRTVDHYLPWDFTAILKVSRPEIFQIKEKRWIPKLRTFFLQDIFPHTLDFIWKIIWTSVPWLVSAVTKRQKLRKIPLGEQMSATQRVLYFSPKILALFRN